MAAARAHRRPRHRALGRELPASLRDRARGRRRGGEDARAALRRVPAVPARVLRRAPDRAGRLARDQRPLPDPVLHRLGPRPGRAERDDDRRRGHRARGHQPGAGPVERAPAAAHRHRGLAVRTPRDPDLAPGAGPQGRCHRVGRRGGRGHRDGAGVRPRGRRAAALRRPRERGARRGAAPGTRRVPPPAEPVLPAIRLGRRGALPRRSRGDRRHAHLRRVRAVHPAAAPARLAARGHGLDHQPRPARARIGRPLVRVAGARAAPAGTGPAAAVAGGPPAQRAAARRALRLPRLRGGAHRRRPDRRARRGARGLRRDRRGQVHAAQPRPPLSRPDRRHRAPRRARPARAVHLRRPRCGGARHPAAGAVLRAAAHEPGRRAARCRVGGRRGGL